MPFHAFGMSDTTIQRKATCACGGDCPRCAGELQAKLQVGTPGDQYEQEADRVADQVMRMSAPPVQNFSTPVGPLIQRKCASSCFADATPAINNVLGSSGAPLDAASRAFFESRFGHDFSNVRVHSDVQAAESAQQLRARAYTAGQNIVFGAGQYQPQTTAGRHLLAHELTHVLQQGDNVGVTRPIHVQRTTDPDASGPCDQPHIDDLIEPAFTEARRWRRLAAEWLEAHLDHIRQRGALSRDGYVRIGQRVYDELMLLERHFRISTVLRVSLPYAPNELVSVTDLERFGNASYWVRRRFGEVELSVSYLCQANCPRGRTGSHWLGSARPGFSEVTFYTNCFDRQHEKTRAGVALHEAFHARFSEFDHDTYSFESGYPGSGALTNAESYSTFAAIVATGSGYRITLLPEITIHGTP